MMGKQSPVMVVESFPVNVVSLKPKSADEEKLAHAIRDVASGDARAFRVIVDLYAPLVFNFIFQMTQDATHTEDLVQETFLKVYQNLARYDRRRAFRPWLLKIASNTTLSSFRKRNVRDASQVVNLDDMQDATGYEPQAREETDLDVERRMTSEEVLKLIAQLKPNYRQALLLRFVHELSYEEVAEALDIPVNTVRTWIKRGREQLIALATPLIHPDQGTSISIEGADS